MNQRSLLIVFLTLCISHTLSSKELNCSSSNHDLSSTNKFSSSNKESYPPKKRAVYPYYVSGSVRSLHDTLYRDIFQAILDEGLFFNSDKERSQGPFQFKSKDEIREIIDFELPFKRTDHTDLLEIVKNIIRYSPHPSHPFKVDRHSVGLDPYGLVGDWIGTSMSSNVVTYALAPVFTLMEYEVQKRVRELVYGTEIGDGMFAPGTSMGNGYAIQCALQWKFQNFKMKGFIGIQSPKAVLFVSEQGSFFYDRYAIWEGMGLHAVIRVATDAYGRMDVKDLESKIEEAKLSGQVPFLVIGTAGTPILGAVDPLDKIGKIAKKNGMWFHVDGQLAGSTFLSDNQKDKLKGIELSDSFLWSADKGLSAPYVTTVLVTKEENVMRKTFSFGADYVFNKSPLYNNTKWDNGDHTLQTSRRPDVLKIWLMWKAKGTNGLAHHIDHTYEMTKYAVEELKRREPSFQLILPEFESNNVAFYYIPSSLRNLPHAYQQIAMAKANFTENLKVVLLKTGVVSISISSLPSSPSEESIKDKFFVMNLANSVLGKEDINYILDQITDLGESAVSSRLLIQDEPIPMQMQTKASAMDADADMNVFVHVDFDLSIPSEVNDLAYCGEPLLLSWHLPSHCSLKTVPITTTTDILNDTTTTATGENISTNTNSTARQTFMETILVSSARPSMSPPSNFVNSPIESLHEQFIEDYLNAVLEHGTYYEEKRRSEPALIYKPPEELLATFDFSLSKEAGVGTMRENEVELLDIVKNIIKYSGHYAHPYYNFQLAPAMDPYTIMADYVIATINSPMTTYEDNPIFTVMEEELTKSVGKLVGYPEDCEGLILPGGSAGNQLAFHLAYMTKKPQAKLDGVIATNKTLVAFLNAGGHYSTDKAAFFSGIGQENVVHVKTDERGRISVEDLKQRVKETEDAGKIPFLVVATIGTTVLGSFDQVNEIADVCEKHGIWLHIDGSYGGSTLMSPNATRKALALKGLHRSDSFTLNPHKVFGSIRESTVTIVKKKGLLKQVSPDPSFQEFNNEILYDGKENDPGVKQLFTERRANVFKMWFLWKAKGMEGLGEHVEYGFNLTQQVYKYLKENSPSFILVHPNSPPESPNVNFYYIPKRFREREDKNSPEFWKEIEMVQLEIIRLVFLNNKIVLSAKPFMNLPSFLVLCLYNSVLTFEDVKYMIDMIDFYGQDM